MIHADPWDEVIRLEELLEAELLEELERSRLRASVEAFCVDECQIDGRCRLARAIRHTDQCPLWLYVGAMPANI